MNASPKEDLVAYFANNNFEYDQLEIGCTETSSLSGGASGIEALTSLSLPRRVGDECCKALCCLQKNDLNGITSTFKIQILSFINPVYLGTV